MRQQAFKRCPRCRHGWLDRGRFLGDPDVQLVGYQLAGIADRIGLFLFNHMRPQCGTTMTVAAAGFADLHEGPVFRERLQGGPECPGHCLSQRDLGPCPARCECRFVRDVLHTVKEWPKDTGPRVGGRRRRRSRVAWPARLPPRRRSSEM